MAEIQHNRDREWGMDRFLYRLFDLEGRLPASLRAPYRGALFIFGLLLGWTGKFFLLATLTALVALAGIEQGIALLGRFLGIAIVAGAAGGAVSGMLEPLGRLGRLGEWFRWTLALFGCLAAFSLLLPPVPLALPDPAFFWAAGAVSMLGAIGLVVTDDRGRNRLPPHQFRIVRHLASLRGAPRRRWLGARERLEANEATRLSLMADLECRPTAREELLRLVRTMRTDIGQVRNDQERFARLIGVDSCSLEEAKAWLARIDQHLEDIERSTLTR